MVNDKAARNASVILGPVLAGLSVYYGAILQAPVPVALLNVTPILGAAVKFITDLALRRA